MAELKLEHIYKVYPNGVKAVSDFTMNIKDQEFIVFVGPSGCGKSTTLRMIAGLEDISAGELYIGDRIVNDVEPKDRDIAMVFQNYALYPHMTVYENMAFGLQLRHVPTEEIHEKVIWAANILGLTEYLDRKPKAMSGGQRQRVALGRAILRNPKVMLLDEPLSNLDAKLRAQMRTEIAKLHQDLKTTFIYVTHDQIEAMTLGTRVVVMKLGVIQQIDAPKNLYDYPANKFVAGFIGTPQMNFFEGKLLRNGDKIKINFDYSDNQIEVDVNSLIKVQPQYFDGNHPIWIGIRCENLSIDEEIVKNSNTKIKMKVSHFEELGNETLIYGDINMEGSGFDDNSTRIVVKALNTHTLKPGDIVDVHFDCTKAHFFDKETEESIVPRVPTLNVISSKVEDNVIIFDNLKYELPESIKIENQDGLFNIPIEAIQFDDNGKFSGKVEQIEKIGEQTLVYIRLNERVIFALNDKLNVGDDVKFNLNICSVKFVVNNQNLIKTVEKYNHMNSTFLNFATASSATVKENELHVQEKYDSINNKYDLLIKECKEAYANKIQESNKKDFNSIRSKNDALLKEEETKYKESMQQLKETYVSGMKNAKVEHNIKLKEVKEQVKAEYDRQKDEENSSYKKFLSINKDKDVYRKRKQEHEEFKENFPKERENALKRAIDNETLRFETTKNEVKSPYKRNKKVLKNNFSDFKKRLDHENNEVKYLNVELEKNIKKLEKERKIELQKAKQIFFFKISDRLVLSPELISNKMIQGLGTKVFVKNFDIAIPNDKMVLSDDGFTGKVLRTLNFGDQNFIEISFVDENKKESILNIKSDASHKPGDVIYFTFDLLDANIVESSLNIRIY